MKEIRLKAIIVESGEHIEIGQIEFFNDGSYIINGNLPEPHIKLLQFTGKNEDCQKAWEEVRITIAAESEG